MNAAQPATPLAPQVSDDLVTELLALAVRAPNGNNVQPWLLRRTTAGFELRFDATRTRSVLDIGDIGSRIGAGALFETLAIAAAARGIVASFELDPDPGEPDLWARVTLASGEAHESPLVDAITKRCTNRSAFDGRPLAEGELDALRSECARQAGVRARLFADRSAIEALARLVGGAETVRTTIRAAHEELHDVFRWTTDDASRKKDGIKVRASGANVFERFALRLTSVWWMMRILIAFGGARLQGRHARALGRGASAFAWIGVDTLDPVSAMNAGRVMQRIWLTATAMGLDVSPFAALPLLTLLAERGPEILDGGQLAHLLALKSQLATTAGTPGTCLILMRIGHGCALPPALRSERREVKELLGSPQLPTSAVR